MLLLFALIRLKIRSSTSTHHFGLPPNYFPNILFHFEAAGKLIPNNLIIPRYYFFQKNNDFTSSIVVNRPALMNVFLFETHPSCSLASAVYWTESLQKQSHSRSER